MPMTVQGLKTIISAVMLCVIAVSISNFVYSNALDSNLILTDDGWVHAPEKYIPSYDELSKEEKQEYNAFVKQGKSSTPENRIIAILTKDYKKTTTEASWWSKEIMRASRDNSNVSPREIMSILAVESRFTKYPKGNRNVGPMQVNKGVWHKKTKYDLSQPSDNIQLGTRIYSEYKRNCRGNTECAFKSYNVGPGDYQRKNKIAKQRSYYQSIMKAYKRFSSIA